MEERLPRAEILKRLNAEYARLQATLSRLNAAQMALPGVVGEWSVKDVLAHLIYWNDFATSEIHAAVEGQAFPHPQGSTDEINARAVAEYRGSALVTVQAGFEASYTHLRELVKRLPDDAFKPGSPIEAVLDETIHGALANNTYEHWPIHEQQIREWLEKDLK